MRPLIAFTLLALASCGDTIVHPSIEEPAVSSSPVSLAIAVDRAPVGAGDEVTVAVELGEALGVTPVALDGHLRFDTGRFRYVGQVLEGPQIVMLNGQMAAAGELRFLSFNPDGSGGLGAWAALFRFEALAAWQGDGSPFHLEVDVVSENRSALHFRSDEVRLTTSYAAGTPAQPMTSDDWASRLRVDASVLEGVEITITVPDLEQGDCTLNGFINVLDALLVAQMSVGNAALPSDPAHFALCDMAPNGVINVMDVLEVAELSVRANTPPPLPPPPPPPPPPPLPPGTGGGGPNEPAGFTRLTERDFRAGSEAGWWNALGFGAGNIVTDASPTGDNLLGRVTFPEGLPGSGATAVTGYTFSSQPRDLYIAAWHKVSANWQSHPAGSKVLFAVDPTGGNGGGDPFYLIMVNFGGGTYEYEGRKQGPTGSVNYPRNVGNVRVTVGAWAHIEILLRSQTSPASSDGELHVWVNGSKVTQFTNIPWSPSGAKRTWEHVKWEPIWGGVGATVNQTQYQYMDNVYVSGS